MTQRLYLEDADMTRCDSCVIDLGQDKRGFYTVLDRTVFYPQGGGQPSDVGFLSTGDLSVPVLHVADGVYDDCGSAGNGGEIRHYIDKVLAWAKGTPIQCRINHERRQLNARYHTAAHLLGSVVEAMLLTHKAVKGHSFPGEAYVIFEREMSMDIDRVALQEALDDTIASNSAVQAHDITVDAYEAHQGALTLALPCHKKFRVVQIGTMPPVPCGGTHVKSLGCIGQMGVRSVRYKNKTVRIAYEVT